MRPLPDEPFEIYEFGDFRLDVRELRLFRSGSTLQLEPKCFDVLVALVRRAPSRVTIDVLMKDVWPDVAVEENNVQGYVSKLRKVLGDTRSDARFIETARNKSYRFTAPVVRVPPERPDPLPPEVRSIVDHIADRSGAAQSPAQACVGGTPQAWFLSQAVVASFQYAVLFVVALFVEVAYRFDTLGSTAWRLAPIVFTFAAMTTGAALWLDWRLARAGRNTGVVVSPLVIIAAGFALWAGVAQFLPADPVTEATFRTYTAQTAFLKSCIYLVPLAVVYVALPFHLALALDGELRAGSAQAVARLLDGKRSGRAPRGAVYLRVWWLAMALLVAAAFGFLGMTYLIDNLRDAPYANLFTKLEIWRVALYFLLGSECVIWYYLILSDIRHRAAAGEPR